MMRYDSYKPSGIDWLGDVPDHWDIKKLKYISKIKTGEKDTENKVDNGLYPFFVRSDKVEKINSYSFDGEAVLTAGDGVGVGKVFHYVNGKFEYHQRVYKISNFRDISGKYFYYYLKDNFYKEVLKLSAKSTVDSIRLPMLANFIVSIPPKDEQKAIVDFLDKKCESIDTYILKQKELIELLKEKKSSLINDAVTRGLDSSVKYKKSGVEWLGEIPKHWEVKKLKYISYNLNNRRIPIESSIRGKMEKQKYDYYGATGVIDKVDNYIFDEPTIVVAEDGANLVFRNIKLVYLADGKYWVNNHAHILKASKNQVREYIAYFLESFDYNPLISGSAQPKLTKEKFMNIDISIPPKEEQKQIVKYIEKETKKIDDIISHIDDEIKLLQEYKQSIISSAVTGKIKVDLK